MQNTISFSGIFFAFLAVDALLVGWLLYRPARGHQFKPGDQVWFGVFVIFTVAFILAEQVIILFGLWSAAMGALAVAAMLEEGGDVHAAISLLILGSCCVLAAWVIGEAVSYFRRSVHSSLGLPGLRQHVR